MHRSTKVLLLISIVLTIYLIVGALSTPTTVNQAANKQNTVDETQFPIADEAAPEPPRQADRAKRDKKEKKYKKYKETVGPGVTVASAYYHWPPGFPTLPVAQSDAVIIGEVLDAKAYLTADKEEVYSEFTVRVTKVLKGNNQTPLSIGASIIVERPGGRVRYRSGHVSRFSITGWGMPRAAGQYVFFLTRNDDDESYHIVTGYELRGGHVLPLDKTTSNETDFDAYTNMDEIEFFKRLDSVIAMPSQTNSQ
jgi:hypothetical protein